MKSLGWSLPGSFRHGLILALLAATVLLAAILAYQGLDAERSHRATAEGVLRDYAELAAEQFVSRSATLLGYGAIYGALVPFGNKAPLTDFPTSIVDTKTGIGFEDVSYFRWPLGQSVEMAAGAESVDQAVWDGLSDEVTRYENGWYYALFFPEQESLAIAYQMKQRSGQRVVEGFVFDRGQLEKPLRRALAEGPLLPATLTKGAFDNSLISITVTDPRSRAVFKTHPESYAYASYGSINVAATLPGGLRSLNVGLALRPEAAPHLIIGGLPRSRLPLLILLLLLTTGLVGVAVFQLLRERDLVRRQTDFVAGVSHEFRTPLAQIRMFAETLLLKRVRSDDEERRALEIIDQEVLRLSHLVENVMLFSRSVRKGVRVDRREFQVAPVLEEMVERFPALAGSTGSRLEVEAAAGLQLRADEDALRQVLLNLLDNAVKYGAAGQTVRLTASTTGDRVRLSVQDQGEGVAPADRRRIWERFERLRRHRNSGVAGTGVGLAVVREVVEAMQGRVWVEEGPGHGASFVVELARGKDRQPERLSGKAIREVALEESSGRRG